MTRILIVVGVVALGALALKYQTSETLEIPAVTSMRVPSAAGVVTYNGGGGGGGGSQSIVTYKP